MSSGMNEAEYTATGVVRVAQDVEQPWVGRNQQPLEAAFGDVEQGLPPRGPAVRTADADPALHRIGSIHVFDDVRIPGDRAEDA